MYIQQSSAQHFSLPGGTTGTLYPPSPRGDQSVAVVSMRGAYPENGFVYNDRCTETLLMLEGTFSLTYGDEQYALTPGDLFMILPGTKYKLEGNGKAAVCISPSWDATQQHYCD